MDEKQKELQQNLYALEVYKSQLENLLGQSELVENSLIELMQTKETLEKMKELEDKEYLVPIGSGTFVFGKITNNKMVITSIGSNISVEEDIEKIIQRIDKRIRELGNLNQKIAEGIEGIQTQYSELRQKIQEYSKEEKKI